MPPENNNPSPVAPAPQDTQAIGTNPLVNQSSVTSPEQSVNQIDQTLKGRSKTKLILIPVIFIIILLLVATGIYFFL